MTRSSQDGNMWVVPRLLTARALNRALLARQLLLARADLSIVAALEQVGGLQTQYAPSGYVGLWSRVAGFERQQLTSALEAGRVIQATLMRSTIHMVSPKDFRLFSPGVRSARREWWLATARSGRLAGFEPERLPAVVREELADGPRDRARMVAAVTAAGFDKGLWEPAGAWVDMVRVPPSGTWDRRRADLFGLADHWVKGEPASEHDGLVHLVKRYLRGFGPASLGDIASWSGVKKTVLASIVEPLRLRRFVDESGGELLDVPGAPLPDPDTPAPVRFLPKWDANLLVHARRTLVLPEEYRALVFSTKNPQSVGTILVDGAVAGAWHWRENRLDVEPFRRLSSYQQQEVDEEAERLAEFHKE